MQKLITILVTFVFVLSCNDLFSQNNESKYKKVVINKTTKKVDAVKPEFEIGTIQFTDNDNNKKIDGKEDCRLSFNIRNTGNILLNNIMIKIDEANGLTDLNYIRTQEISKLNINDSILVTIPITSSAKLKNGNAQFKITVTDASSGKNKYAQILVPTRELITIPIFNWLTPDSNRVVSKFAVVDLYGLVKTKARLTGVTLYINNRIATDNRNFDILPTDTLGEYRLKRTVTLNEGDNEIKIVTKNEHGATTSETRIINYYVQKIDLAYTEKRLALVIGNADYVHGNVLANPINDSKAIANALQEVGFTVLLYENADQKTMKRAMDEFGEKLQDYNVGLFYYAGHGIQVKGNNYLIPVDASLKVEQDVDYDCIDAGRLLGKMEAAGTTTNIVILDACRDNPFERSWSTRSSGKGSGLAFMNAPSGSIVAYATSPGKTASDGTGANGLYTEAILQFIKVPGLTIEEFFKNVRTAVEAKSNKTQTPWESTSLKGNFYFKIK